jgi:DNA adenine methylase
VPDFCEKDHRDLAELLANVKAKWLLTIGDHSLVRELYADFRIREIQTQLAVEKIANGHARRRLRHLVIMNYDPTKKERIQK